MYSTLMEVYADGHISMLPSVFAGIRNKFLANIDLRINEQLTKETEMQGLLKFKAGQRQPEDFCAARLFVSDAVSVKYWEELEDDDRIVNVVRLTGAMTRGGGDCSYGSIEIRDRMMRAADIKQTVAHVIYTRTPGGMASTLRDFRMAINYCHERGQKVYMFCDGDVASCGAFLSAMCDATYANNPQDEFGSLGVYRAFFSLADGAENKITSEVYHECYAEASVDKNKCYRDAANDDDMQLAQEEVNQCMMQLLADLKKDRPGVSDAYLTGKMYPMAELKNVFIDGFMPLVEVAQLALDEYERRQGAPIPRKEPAVLPEGGKSSDEEAQKQTPKNHKEMSKTYKELAAFIGEQPMESDKDNNLTLQEAQADALEQHCGQVNAQLEQLSEENTRLKNELATVESQADNLQAENKKLAEDLAQKTEENRKSGDTEGELKVQAEAYKLAAEKSAQELADAKAEVDELKAYREKAENQLKELSEKAKSDAQTIADLQDEVSALNRSTGKEPEAGSSPKNNGSGPQVPHLEAGPVYDDTLSPGENARRREQYLKELEKRAYGNKNS